MPRNIGPARGHPPRQAAAMTLTDPIAMLELDAGVRRLADALGAGRRCVASGAAGSSTALVSAAIARRTHRPLLLVVAHIDEAEETLEELESLGTQVIRLPALEVLPGESSVSLDLFAERINAVRAVLAVADDAAPVIVAPIQALMQAVPAPARLGSVVRTLSMGDRADLTELTRWLATAGYRRCDALEEPGDFAVRGGILDVFPTGDAEPVRLDFFGDTIDKINLVDLDTMGSDRAIQTVELVCADLKLIQSDDGSIPFTDLLPRRSLAVVAETAEITEQARGYYERISDPRGILGPPAVLAAVAKLHAVVEINQFSAGAASADTRVELPVAMLPAFSRDAAEAVRELMALAAEGRAVDVYCQTPAEGARLEELLAEARAAGAQGNGTHPISMHVAYLHRGFNWDGADARGELQPRALVPYHELLNRFTARRRGQRLKSARAMDTFLDFQAGDYVVHAEHGIARYAGLHLLRPQSVVGEQGALAANRPQEPEEYLTLEFAGRAKLHVPVSRIDLVQKYVGGFSGTPPLSTLGGLRWQSQKDRAAESVRELAAEMLRVRAAREHMPGIAYPADTPWQTQFEAEFPYDETEDQLACLAQIKRDMSSPRPMDRLVCGDVGFGKTELAIRAAFKACEFGKQVAVLVPTTVLAEQHERTFRSRFAGYPFKVESLSRFKSAREQNQILAAVRKGHVDLVIGTHRLLSPDVRFADLGVVIIDEEQRFGVEHKERLLRLRLTVDVLTLSATPIPRTLHMAMLGLRDISSLTTPPIDRRAIVTEVIPYNERRIAQALARELAREGQVYFVHNRVNDIKTVADDVRRLAPEGARIVWGHGQMAGDELEDVMLRFARREADILVSTTIIESGLDIPTANTMIINDADRFGLSELHQLRGRVGRSRHRAYCYLLLPKDRPVRDIAQKRLKAIEKFSMLGAGFKIAMRDLEIRGAGNLLGAEQSGHIAVVGYDMYCRLLEDAVRELKNEKPPELASATSLDIGITGVIPKPYIPSDQRRLEAYRRIAVAGAGPELDKVRADLVDAYGPPPTPVERLLDLARTRLAAASLGVKTVALRDMDVVFRTIDPAPLAARLSPPGRNLPGRVTVLPPKTGDTLAEVYFRPPESYLADPATLLLVLMKRLSGEEEPTSTRQALQARPAARPTTRPTTRPDARPPSAPRH